MIDFQRKIVLIHPPRCGGSSFEETLYQPEGYFKRYPWLKHRSYKEYLRIIRLRGERVEDYDFFGLVRHPDSRLKSMYGIGYWRNSVVYPKRIEKMFKRTSYARFISLVQPASHEGKNLKLIDYYDGNGEFPIYDISQHKALQDVLKLPDILTKEVTPKGAKPKGSLFSRSAIAYRFRDDLSCFGYEINSPHSYVLGAIIVTAYTSLYRFLWNLRSLRSRGKMRQARVVIK